MRRSQYRRANKSTGWFSGRRRIIAVAATVVAFGGIITVTQVSNAATNSKNQKNALTACDQISAPPPSKLSTQTRRGTWTENNGRVTQHADDGAGATVSTAELRSRCRQWVANNVGNTTKAGQGNNNGGKNQGGQNGGQQQGGQNGGQNGGQQQGNNNGGKNNNGGQQGNNGGQQGNNNGGNNNGGNNNGGNNQTPPPGAGLGVLTNSCATSKLQPHDGFQKGNRCVSTEFGEVGNAANNPSLLIVKAPQRVNVGQAFTFTVSTRNLIRDRFLAAGQGGYYVESSVLQGGLVRGHFHSACRILNNTNEAPAPDPVPEFFVATEDKRGGAAPDFVNIQVPGIPKAGTLQCTSWAGDGSHRIPMMERANQTPAIDSVRIQVGGQGGNNQGGNNNQGNNQGGNNQGGKNNQGGQQGGKNNQGGQQQGGNNNGGQQQGNNNGGQQQGGNNNGGRR